MSYLKHQASCTNCSATLRANTKEILDCVVKAHNHKKHPLIYALTQNYAKINDKLMFESTVVTKKRRRIRKHEMVNG